MSREGVIGRGGSMPWRLPRDLKHFRLLTWGKPIIMGRKTHESLGRLLPGRTNIVLTHQAEFRAEGCLVAHASDQALALAEATGSPEAMVIGGSGVYQTFLPHCETMHLTLVEGQFEGDVYFPVNPLKSPDWQVIQIEEWPADERNPHPASYIVLQRRAADAGQTSGLSVPGL
jgi:dihydrofolate reductase